MPRRGPGVQITVRGCTDSCTITPAPAALKPFVRYVRPFAYLNSQKIGIPPQSGQQLWTTLKPPGSTYTLRLTRYRLVDEFEY